MKRQIWFHFCKLPGIVKFIETESGMVVPILEGLEVWEDGV